MLKPHNSPRAEEVKAERGQVLGLSELVGAFQIHAGGQVTSSEGPSGSPSPHPVKGSCILPCCSAALGSSRARRSGCPEGSWHWAHFLLGGEGRVVERGRLALWEDWRNLLALAHTAFSGVGRSTLGFLTCGYFEAYLLLA